MAVHRCSLGLCRNLRRGLGGCLHCCRLDVLFNGHCLRLCLCLFLRRLRLCFRGFGLQDIALYYDFFFRSFLFLLVRLLLASKLNHFLELDSHFFRIFLKFQVFTELCLYFREIHIRHLCVRIHLHIGSFLVEEVNESLKSDAELFCQFT